MVQPLSIKIGNQNLTFFTNGIVSLRDNIPISKRDYLAACNIISNLDDIRRSRREFCEDRGLDPSIFIPDNVWSEPFVEVIYNSIQDKTYERINNMRLFCPHFSGHRLIELGFPEGNTGYYIDQIPENFDEMLVRNKDKLLDNIYYFAVSLKNMSHDLIAAPPRMFGEVGIDFCGIIYNADTWSTQLRLNAMYSAGIIQYLRSIIKERGYCTILEIGTGYGALAYSLKRILGQVKYILVDLPESLPFSTIYLSTLFANEKNILVNSDEALKIKDARNIYLPNHLLESHLEQIEHVDMVLNTLSFAEMTPAQVEFYAQAAKQLIGGSGFLFEINWHSDVKHTDVKRILAEHFAYRRSQPETLIPFQGQGFRADIWANQYIGQVFDVSDRMLFQHCQITTQPATHLGQPQ